MTERNRHERAIERWGIRIIIATGIAIAIMEVIR